MENVEKLKEELRSIFDNKKEQLRKEMQENNLKEIVKGFLIALSNYSGYEVRYEDLKKAFEDDFVEYLYNEYGKTLEYELEEKIESIDTLSEEEENMLSDFVDELIDKFMNVDELSSIFIKTFEDELKKEAKENIEDIFKRYQSIGIVVGVSGLTHRYQPCYKVYSERVLKNKRDLQNTLEELGIEPHAWGIISSYNQWGNYWWIILDKDNYQKMIEENTDIAFLCYIGDENYQVFRNLSAKSEKSMSMTNNEPMI